jgi:hypothetical protein
MKVTARSQGASAVADSIEKSISVDKPRIIEIAIFILVLNHFCSWYNYLHIQL